MSKFITELDARLINDDTVWQLDNPLVYESDSLGRVVEIPKGFQTDFASVPRWIPFASNALMEKAHREGVLHDYLYRKDSDPIASFSQANYIFREAMEAREKPVYIRWPMFWGVWIGGYFSFHKRNVMDEI
jgi:hypothetical protein